MLLRLRLSFELESQIHEAQARSMRQLLDGWDEEIKAHAEALKQAAKKQAEQAARDAALAASLEVYLRGLVTRAQTGDDQVVSIPTGISVASTIAGGPSIDALHSLAEAVSEADDQVIDPAQRSAAWAVSHGFMPHPSDLASILDRLGIDPEWSDRFRGIAEQMAGAEKLYGPHPQLQAKAGLQKLTALKDETKVLDAYGADRLFRLVADPRSLVALDREPPQAAGRSKMVMAAIDQAMRHVRSR